MTRTILITITICIALNCRHGASNFGQSRRAVVLEAFYALRQTADGGCDTIQGNCVSSWNFLNDPNQPPGSFLTVKTWFDQPDGKGSFTCLASNWMTAMEQQSWSSDINCIKSLAPEFLFRRCRLWLEFAGGQYGNVGRGGQCVFFANLVLYRSGSDRNEFQARRRCGVMQIRTYNMQWKEM